MGHRSRNVKRRRRPDEVVRQRVPAPAQTAADRVLLRCAHRLYLDLGRVVLR